MSKTILITGTRLGLRKGAAIGMAKNGHKNIATFEVSPMVTALRAEVEALGLSDSIPMQDARQ
jgi:NAD(P)-dependent dehydrogenase (short-subunit alcohol dehydrogenase family)